MPRLHLPSSRNLFSLLLLLRKSRSLLPLFLLYGSYFTHALLFLELGSFHGLVALPKKTVCFVFFGSFLRSAGTVQCVFFLFPFVLFLTELRFRLCSGDFGECFTLSPRLQHFELHLLAQLLLLTLSNKLDAFALAFHHLLPFALCFGLTHRQIVAASIGKLFLDDHHAGLDQLIYCIASQPVIRLQLHGCIIAVFARAFEVRQTLHEDLFVSHTLRALAQYAVHKQGAAFTILFIASRERGVPGTSAFSSSASNLSRDTSYDIRTVWPLGSLMRACGESI